MRRWEALQGVRVMRILDILGRYEAAEFNQMEAAELLGIGERTFRRWRQRFEDDGEAGLFGSSAGQGVGQAGSDRSRGRGRGFVPRALWGSTAKHFHEHLVTRHNFSWGYTWTKTFIHSRGLLRRRRSGAARTGASGSVGRCRG